MNQMWMSKKKKSNVKKILFSLLNTLVEDKMDEIKFFIGILKSKTHSGKFLFYIYIYIYFKVKN